MRTEILIGNTEEKRPRGRTTLGWIQLSQYRRTR